MPRALYNPSIDASLFRDAKRSIIAAGDYLDYADLFTDSSLLHLIYPEEVAFAAKADRDWGSQKRFSWSDASISKSAADAAWNSKDVWHITGTAGDMHFDVGSVPSGGKFSIAMAVSLADLAQSFHHLFVVYNPVSTVIQSYLRYAVATGPGFTFLPAVGSTTNSYSASVPAQDEPFVIGIDYDKTSNTSRMWIDDPDTSKHTVSTHTAAWPSDMSGYQWRIGNLFGSSLTGLKGKMGDIVILNSVWSDDLRTSIFNAIKTKFAIS